MNSLFIADGKDNINGVLTKMIKDDKYKPYLDQIYYVLAQNAVQENGDSTALVLFNESLKNSTNNVRQKGMSFVGKADLLYNKRVKKY